MTISRAFLEVIYGFLGKRNKRLKLDYRCTSVKIITSKDKEGLEVLRHDAAHIMAMAVQELFPKTQVTIGPVIEDGFYYDFSRKEPFTEKDLTKIENRIHNQKFFFFFIFKMDIQSLNVLDIIIILFSTIL